MSSKPVNQWDYQKVWENLHPAVEKSVQAKKLIGESRELDNKVNNEVYLLLVEADAKLQYCSQLISAMTTEESS